MMFDRKINLKIGNTTFTYPDFDINFNVPSTTQEEPDVVEINIYNLANESVNAILTDTQVILNAGYGNDLGNLFTGKVETVFSEWSGTNKVTTILCSELGSQLRRKKIKKSYDTQVKASFIMRDLIKHWGVGIGDFRVVQDKIFKDGYTVDNEIYRELRKLAKETKSKIYTHVNKVFIRQFNTGTSSGVVLNSNTGLIGTPSREEIEDENGKKIVNYKLESLLNHNIKRDIVVKVQSRELNGKYRVLECTHTGDFKTEILIRT